MAQTTFSNGRGIVHKGSGGQSIIFPDVCKTPGPPVPIPYPNIGKASDTSKGPKTVKMDGQMPMVKGAEYSTSYGDEAGVGGGVISGVNRGTCKFLNYSFNVFFEGKNVCRLGDLVAHNNSNTLTAPEIGEGFASSIAEHEPEKCPFCKEPLPVKTYKTFVGKETNGGILGRIMQGYHTDGKEMVNGKEKDKIKDVKNTNAALMEEQKKGKVTARPKDGENGNQETKEPQYKPEDDTRPEWEMEFKSKWQHGDTKEGHISFDFEGKGFIKARTFFGLYSSQAHHLISGRQALAAKPKEGDNNGDQDIFQKWLIGGSKIKMEHPQTGEEITVEILGDSGYSVNNADNGIWCPSMPHAFIAKEVKNENLRYSDYGKTLKWSRVSWGTLGKNVPAKKHDETGEIIAPKEVREENLKNAEKILKRESAFWIMRKTGIQFHSGAHNIIDKSQIKEKEPTAPPSQDAEQDTDEEEKHNGRYDKYIINYLKQLHKEAKADLVQCLVCKGEEIGNVIKVRPNIQLHKQLDKLSEQLREMITTPEPEAKSEAAMEPEHESEPQTGKNWEIFLSQLALDYRDSFHTSEIKKKKDALLKKHPLQPLQPKQP